MIVPASNTPPRLCDDRSAAGRRGFVASLSLLEGLRCETAIETSRWRRYAALLAAALALAAPRPLAAQPSRDGQRDFDFEHGAWKAHIRRLTKPLAGSNTWVEYDGTSIVRPLWGGRANLGELDVRDTAGSRIVGLSLRLYDPETRQWKIHWANARDGELGPAMIGSFANGRGEFYNQERFDGKAVFVRFIFSDVTPTTFRLEQAFSADGGKTWEPNWIATFARQPSRGSPLE